jgi:phosphatidylserine decarboxylase
MLLGLSEFVKLRMSLVEVGTSVASRIIFVFHSAEEVERKVNYKMASEQNFGDVIINKLIVIEDFACVM